MESQPSPQQSSPNDHRSLSIVAGQPRRRRTREACAGTSPPLRGPPSPAGPTRPGFRLEAKGREASLVTSPPCRDPSPSASAASCPSRALRATRPGSRQQGHPASARRAAGRRSDAGPGPWCEDGGPGRHDGAGGPAAPVVLASPPSAAAAPTLRRLGAARPKCKPESGPHPALQVRERRATP
jgi:hypothetical protein